MTYPIYKTVTQWTLGSNTTRYHETMRAAFLHLGDNINLADCLTVSIQNLVGREIYSEDGYNTA